MSLSFAPMVFLYILAAAYAGALAHTLYYWCRTPVAQLSPATGSTLFLSVVIAARNEARNIAGCLRAILGNDYPAACFEVIVVDDHSTDDTVSVVQSFSDRNVRLLRLPEGAAGKKAALALGISHAKGTWIACTDADCLAPRQWLGAIADAANRPGAVAVAGPVLFAPVRGLLQHFQALDFVGTMVVTAAGFQSGQLFLGNGANLAFSKEAYMAVGGYREGGAFASGDDVFLLQQLARERAGGLIFIKNAGFAVQTPPEPTLQAFFNQRLRWATKNAALPHWNTRVVAGLVWLYCWVLLLLSVAAFWVPEWALPALALWLVKICADFALLHTGCRFFKKMKLLRWFLPAQAMHVAYILAVGTAGIFIGRYEWKGRKVK